MEGLTMREMMTIERHRGAIMQIDPLLLEAGRHQFRLLMCHSQMGVVVVEKESVCHECFIPGLSIDDQDYTDHQIEVFRKMITAITERLGVEYALLAPIGGLSDLFVEPGGYENEAKRSVLREAGVERLIFNDPRIPRYLKLEGLREREMCEAFNVSTGSYEGSMLIQPIGQDSLAVFGLNGPSGKQYYLYSEGNWQRVDPERAEEIIDQESAALEAGAVLEAAERN